MRFALNLKKRRIAKAQTLSVLGVTEIVQDGRLVYALADDRTAGVAILHRLRVE